DAVALVAVDHVVTDVDARGRAAAVDDDAAAFRRRRAVALVRGTADEAAADRLAGEAGRALVVALARAVVALAGGSGVVERVRVADGPAVADGTVGFPATGLAGVVAVEARERRMGARVLARLRHAERRRRVAVVADHIVPHVRGGVAVHVLRFPVVERRGVAVAGVAGAGVVQPAVAGAATWPDQAAAGVVREGRVLQRDRHRDRTAVVVADLERLVGAVRGVVRVRGIGVVVRPVAEREPIDDPVPGRRRAGDAARTIADAGARLALLRAAVALGPIVADRRATGGDVEVHTDVVTR